MDVNIFVICHIHVNAAKPEVTTAISLTFVKVVNKVHNAPVVVTKIVVNLRPRHIFEAGGGKTSKAIGRRSS